MKIERKPTIEDVAQRAGVSQMTVSRVVNNSPSVKAPTRQKVLDVIAETGYQQNEAGRLLRGSRAKMIGVIVPDLSDAFFSSCAHVIQQVARSHRYMTLVVSSESDSTLELQAAELMALRKVSGLLIAPSEPKPNRRLDVLQRSGVQVIAFDRPLKGISSDSVLVENRQGAEMAVRHLIEHGHTNIACIGYDVAVYTVEERLHGYLRAMKDAGLTPNVPPQMATLEEVNAWVQQLETMSDRPTAVFSMTHRTSGQFIRSVSRSSLSIPKDLALVGFDDFEFADCVAPPITVVAQSPVDVARRAAHLLFEQIHSPGKTERLSATTLLPVQLIIRTSCGCAQ